MLRSAVHEFVIGPQRMSQLLHKAGGQFSPAEQRIFKDICRQAELVLYFLNLKQDEVSTSALQGELKSLGGFVCPVSLAACIIYSLGTDVTKNLACLWNHWASASIYHTKKQTTDTDAFQVRFAECVVYELNRRNIRVIQFAQSNMNNYFFKSSCSLCAQRTMDVRSLQFDNVDYTQLQGKNNIKNFNILYVPNLYKNSASNSPTNIFPPFFFLFITSRI